MEHGVVCRAIILDSGGKVLLGKRVRGGGAGKWALVGGRPEERETPEQTVVREVKEELGIKFFPKFFTKYTSTNSPDNSKEEQKIWDVYVFSGNFQGNVTIKPDENSETTFVTKDELNNLDVAFNHKDILKQFFNTLN